MQTDYVVSSSSYAKFSWLCTWAAESNDADKTTDERDSSPSVAEKHEKPPSKSEIGKCTYWQYSFMSASILFVKVTCLSW